MEMAIQLSLLVFARNAITFPWNRSPNPFINYTEFWFNHNKPNETIDVLIQIFTVSGKLIKTLHQSVQSEGLLSREITWNGLDDFGNKIGKGVYIYKLQVKSLNSNSKAEKIEKLVILQ